jgi:hypothetical protein
MKIWKIKGGNNIIMLNNNWVSCGDVYPENGQTVLIAAIDISPTGEDKKYTYFVATFLKMLLDNRGGVFVVRVGDVQRCFNGIDVSYWKPFETVNDYLERKSKLEIVQKWGSNEWMSSKDD